MKELIFATVFASTLSFDSQAYHLLCLHNSDSLNPHYESWITHFADDDSTSWENAYDACVRDGGVIYEGYDL